MLLAAADYRSRFIFAEVGANGRISDGGVWLNSEFRKLFNDPSNPLNLPRGYALVGDNAFSLETNFLVPYSGNLSREKRIFNYRLSRLRFSIEDTFGGLKGTFRVLDSRINLKLENVKLVTLSCVVLYNLIKTFEDKEPERVPTQTLSELGINLLDLNSAARPQLAAISIRDNLSTYFNTSGALSFQNRIFQVDRI